MKENNILRLGATYRKGTDIEREKGTLASKSYRNKVDKNNLSKAEQN